MIKAAVENRLIVLVSVLAAGASIALANTTWYWIIPAAILVVAVTTLLVLTGWAFMGAAFLAAALPAGPAAKSLTSLGFHGVSIEIPFYAFLLLLIVGLKKPKLGGWSFFYGALLICLAFGLAIGIARGNSSFEMTRDIVGLLPLASFALAGSVLQTTEQARRAMIAMITGLTVFSAFVIVVGLLHIPPIYNIVQTYWHGSARFYFHNSFLLPAFIGAAVVTALTARRKRLLFLILAGCFMLAAVLSVTRQLVLWSIVAVLAALIYWALARERRRTRALVGVGALFVAALAVIAVIWISVPAPSSSSASVKGNYLSRLIQRTTALPQELNRPSNGRVSSLEAAWHKDVAAFPLGDGLGTLFPNSWARASYNGARTTGFQPIVDSLPLTLLGKLGVLGLLAYLILFGLLFRVAHRCARALKTRPEDPLIRFTLFFPLFGVPSLFLLSLLQSFMFNSPIVVLIAVLFAASSRVATELAANKETPQKADTARKPPFRRFLHLPWFTRVSHVLRKQHETS